MLRFLREKIPYNQRYLPFLGQGLGLSFPFIGFYFPSSCSKEMRSLFESHGIDCTFFYILQLHSPEKRKILASDQLEIHPGLNIIQHYVFIECVVHYYLCISGVCFMDLVCKGFEHMWLQLIFIPQGALYQKFKIFPQISEFCSSQISQYRY